MVNFFIQFLLIWLLQLNLQESAIAPPDVPLSHESFIESPPSFSLDVQHQKDATIPYYFSYKRVLSVITLIGFSRLLVYFKKNLPYIRHSWMPNLIMPVDLEVPLSEDEKRKKMKKAKQRPIAEISQQDIMLAQAENQNSFSFKSEYYEENFIISSSNHEDIYGYFVAMFDAFKLPPKKRKVMITFQRGSFRTSQLKQYYDLELDHDYTFLSFDYPGTQCSKGKLIYNDEGARNFVKTCYEYVTKQGYEKIYIWGISLGGGFATTLASMVDKDSKVKLLILDSTFSRLAAFHGGYIFTQLLNFLTLLKFNNLAMLKNIKTPTCIIASPEDCGVKFENYLTLRKELAPFRLLSPLTKRSVKEPTKMKLDTFDPPSSRSFLGKQHIAFFQRSGDHNSANFISRVMKAAFYYGLVSE